MTVEERPITFETKRGQRLSGTVFEGDGDGPCVLISSATAVKQTFYFNFAKWLVEQGAGAVLAYDYSGIGASHTPETMKTASFRSWMFDDFPAAVDTIAEIANGRTIVGQGHSFGGHAPGVSGEANRFTRYCTMGTLSGSWRHVESPISVWLQCHIALPVVTALFGHVPQAISPGEALPKGVAQDWARWMRMRDYFFSDTSLPETARFAAVTTPFLSVGATDDGWGGKRAVEGFMRRYSGSDVYQVWREPGESGPIGHLGIFRRAHKETHWPVMGNYLLKGALPDGAFKL